MDGPYAGLIPAENTLAVFHDAQNILSMRISSGTLVIPGTLGRNRNEVERVNECGDNRSTCSLGLQPQPEFIFLLHF